MNRRRPFSGVLAFMTLAACAGRTPLPAVGASSAALRAALADTTTMWRVYLPQEVAVRAEYPDQALSAAVVISGRGDSWVASASTDIPDPATRAQVQADRGRSVIDRSGRVSSNSQGQARLRFVVGADGRAERRSIEVISASSTKALAIAVHDALAWQFTPPKLASGQTVRQLVQMNIVFVTPYKSVATADTLTR